MRSFSDEKPTSNDARDHAHWDAVEEVAELLHEERFQEALVALRDVLRADGKNPYAFYFLGIALYETGQLEVARDAYRASASRSRRGTSARGSRWCTCHARSVTFAARSRKGRWRWPTAPGDGDVLHALGLAHLARGGYNAAARRYLEAFLRKRGPSSTLPTRSEGCSSRSGSRRGSSAKAPGRNYRSILGKTSSPQPPSPLAEKGEISTAPGA